MSALEWLLEPSVDPSIRWQTMRDLAGAPESEWGPERARVANQGWGAFLLSKADTDGQWAGGAYSPGRKSDIPGQPWIGTTHCLSLMRLFGLDPDSEQARTMVRLIGENSRWLAGGRPYWEGEFEPCINGITVANGCYFGVDMSDVVERLLNDQLGDGGWNCDTTSARTSFDSSINVLEGLLAYEVATGGTEQSIAARETAEEYFVARQLFLRASTGQPADADYLNLRNPVRWQYDVLRGLDYFTARGLFLNERPDPRLDLAVTHLVSSRQSDGRWLLDRNPPGEAWFDIDDGEGMPSMWLTLRARRVLDWVNAG